MEVPAVPISAPAAMNNAWPPGAKHSATPPMQNDTGSEEENFPGAKVKFCLFAHPESGVQRDDRGICFQFDNLERIKPVLPNVIKTNAQTNVDGGVGAICDRDCHCCLPHCSELLSWFVFLKAPT
jgi:hypothetical protein